MQNGPNSPGTARADVGVALDTVGLADALRETLALRHPPVALAFVHEAPPGIEEFDGAVPSACTFWRACETRVFFAPAEAHYNCPIGALTMGFTLAEPQMEHLMAVVGQMGEIGYVSADEAGSIPSVPGEKHGIVYGPLAEFPLVPDTVLVWVSGQGAMLLDEATGASRWTPELAGTASFGRPSCAAIAVAAQRGKPTFSVGCSGMRTYTGVDADLHLAVLPGPALADLRSRLERTAAANAQMLDYYRGQKALFSDSAAGPQGAGAR
jgi:uncharacterized protein (DUF169 family)